ncbi:MAG: hypothetical protein O2960_26745 [Verrucomicrobia bacterium]|nr:hypothetical protein [Verrucomicrobiota bacterium]
MRKTIIAAFLALLGVSAQAGQATFDFSSDPTATLNIGGNNPQPWVESGGNPGGFMAITWPTGSQTTGMVFPDIDNGGIITGFRFEADLRIGNSTGDRAADGFSISIARENDPLFADPGNQGLFAGGIMEGGSTTGIAISFDTWSGNTYSDGGDIEGILVRVDDKTVLRHGLPTRHGAAGDATSLQTGPRDAQYWLDGGDFLAPESWATLAWQPVVVDLNEDAQLTVIWKGKTILDKFQTDFFPSAGRLVLAGRTGGANEHTHIDNLKLTTIVNVSDSVPPTVPGNVVAASVGARFAKISWDPATDNSGKVGYQVEKDGGTPSLLNSTSWTDSGLLPGSSYTYRVRAVDISGNSSAWQTVAVKTIAEQDVVGFLLGQIYDGIPGVDVGSLVFSDAYFDGTVSRGVYLNGLSFNVNPGGGFGDNYGIVIKGVLTAPKTGRFDFFVRSDDASQFFLNETGATPPNAATDIWIAEETGCCNAFQEVGASQTTAVPISLTAGREYGFTFVVKEGGGGDWGEVAMREVGDTTPATQLAPIRGELLKGKGDPTGSNVTIAQQPANTTGEEGSFATLTVEANVTSPYNVGAYYQWNKGGQAIPGATRQTLVLRNLSSADAGKYSVKVGTMGKVVTSNEATLTVVPPGQLPGVGSGSVDVRVSSGLDDSEEHITEGNAIDITSSDLEIPDEGGGGDLQVIGIRFRDIAVSKGATITKASIQFTVDESDDEPTSVRIYGELSPDPAQFTTTAGDITGRTKTAAFVDWNNIPVWNGASIGSAGPDQLTPDLSSIVQEIVAQPGWNGNAMVFIIEPNPGGERTAESFDGDQAAAPLLHIEFTTGDGGGFNTDGLVAYWNFDGNLSDSVASFDGEARGAVGFEAGQAGFGQAIALDGTAFVEITGGDHNDLQFPGRSMSIAGWFKVGTFDKSWQALISKGEGTNYRVARRSTENSIAYAGGVGEGANNAPDVNDGNWHHFVAVSDHLAIEFGTALYVDGARYEVNATAPVLATGTSNLFIGENPGALNRQWVGSIDDISIWSRVLKADEVTALYAGGAGMPLSSVVGGGPAPVASSSGSLSTPTVVNFGDLSGSSSYEFVFTAIRAGASTAIAGDNAFAIKLDQWNQQGVFGTTQFGVADNLFTAVAGQSAASVFDRKVHVVVASNVDAGESRLYVDGTLVGTWAGTVPLTGDVKVMGARLTQATDHMGAGSVMDHWATYQGALTDAQIASLAAVWVAPGGGGGISIARSATGVTLTFEGTLQQADSVTGPFTDVAGASSPANLTISGSTKFYRARQ